MQGTSGPAALAAAHAAMELVHSNCERWMALYQAPCSLLGEPARRGAAWHGTACRAWRQSF